ncbi:MAG: carbohydrate ABC transporter permease [Candidatus Eisenbacteria bacterium]|nr:carbohydrate ABC transporter permease [Candidatus Eisenbacteria bacterium]
MKRLRANRLGVWGARAAVVLVCLIPLYWIVNVALSSPTALYKKPLDYFPNPPVADNFGAVFEVNQFPRNVLNSFVIATLTTLLTLALGAPAAYALARLRVRFRNAILALFLGIAIFPAIGMIGPLYVAMARIGLINRYPALVLPYTLLSLPLAVWILTHFFSTLPTSLEDAAMVDGCTPAQAFARIILPLAAPGVFTAAVLIFIFSWNEFLFALILTSSPESRTVPVALALFAGLHELPWATIAAATVISVLPVLVLVAMFQRRIVEGLTTGVER